MKLAKEAGFIVIWGGGKTAAEGKKALGLCEKAGVSLELGAGFPRVVESKDIAGLNPGFHIVVMGFCPKQRDAKKVTRYLNRETLQGVYSKKVKVSVRASTACFDARA